MAVTTDPDITGIQDTSGAPSYAGLTLLGAPAGTTLSVTASTTVASAASAVWDGISWLASTLTLSGSTNVTTATGVNLHNISRPTITSGSAITVTNAASLYIANSPLGAGSTTITNAYSLWVDDGISRFDGPIYQADGSAAAPSYSFATQSGTGAHYAASNRFVIDTGGVYRAQFNGSGLQMRSSASIGWGSSTGETNSMDIELVRQAAGSVGLHNSTSSSSQLSIFNTRTDASNYEALELFHSSNVAILRTAAAGSGTVRQLDIRFGGTTSSAILIANSTSNGVTICNASSSTNSNVYFTTINPNLTGTTGTRQILLLNPTLAPSSSATADYSVLSVTGTINYASGGAGRIQLIRLAPTNTALPTGLNAAITLSSTANALGGMHYHNQSDETTNNEYVAVGFSSDIWRIMSFANGTGTLRGLRFGGTGNSIGFYGAAPVALQTGVAVSAAGIHAALVNLGLITA